MQLEANNLGFRYGKKGPQIFKNVNLKMSEGERVGLLGSSGLGKSTLAKLLAGHLQPTEGRVLLDGRPLTAKGVSAVQMICQHPETAINPRWKMKKVLKESGMLEDILLEELGLQKEWLERYPAELSGGELQRFCVARSLFPGTHFLLADEMSTMLDVITQAQIWSLLLREAEKRRLGLLVVTHNRALAERLCTRLVNLQELMS